MELLVTTEWLANELGASDLRIVDATKFMADAGRNPAAEYEAGHIPGAVRLDNDNLAQFVEAADKQQPLLICCYHGNSSQSAAAYLASLGFSAVYSLDGGFELWQQHFPDQVSRD